jgi:transcriptional regulator with XRE-family HTH domain
MLNGLAIYNLPEIDTNDAEQVQKRIGEYFQICAERGMKPSVAGFAMALGVDRRTLWTWINDKTAKPRAVLDTLKKAYQILNYAIEEYMQNGKINPVSGIFLMKNNFGYKDQSEVVLTPNNPLGEATDRSTLEQKYLDALPSGDAESAEVDLSETQKAAEEG